VVVVGVRVLFKAELGVAIAIAVAFLVVLITISLVHWRNAAEGDRGGAAGAPQSSRQYTGDQYEQLRPGMSVGEVDAIMGGDGQSSESEIGGGPVGQYMNADGSNVTVSFQDGSMPTKAMAGL
jgi:hypothetical protein